MVLLYPDQIEATPLALKPGIHIWHCGIPSILHRLFHKNFCHNYPSRLNVRFKKDDFAIELLNTDEMKTINGFKAMKKQVEWLSGRFLVKHLIQQACMPDTALKDICIAYQDQGAPYIAAHPKMSISLSHSHHRTAAAMSLNKGQTIGIDLERIKKMPDAYFLKTAFTQEEIKPFGNNADLVFKNWTIKEAFLKYIKKGFHESLHKVEVLDNGIRHHGRTVKLDIDTIRIKNEYYLSLVCD